MPKFLRNLFTPAPAAPRRPLTREDVVLAARGMRVFADDLEAGNQLALDLLDDGEMPETAQGWAAWPSNELRAEYEPPQSADCLATD
jgi:hypothetical protein